MKSKSSTETVALLYDEEKNDAPIVVSKGSDLLALKMLEIAKKHNITVVENEEAIKELTKLKVGDEIPYDLYEVISVILAFIYRLEEKV